MVTQRVRGSKNSFSLERMKKQKKKTLSHARNFQPRLKFSFSVWNFHSRLKISIPGPVSLRPERGPDWKFHSRLKTSFLRSGPGKPNQKKSVHELFAGAFRNKSSMWIVLVFLRKNTRIHENGRNSWTFRFGPFFGLVCRGDSWP